jgi:dTDP-4-dehydrorhamnose 3,5-epimerase
MLGTPDPPTLDATGGPLRPAPIHGVVVHRLHNVLTRSGLLTELFRADRAGPVDVQQVNWVEMTPDGVTDWHCHHHQTDRLVGVSGNLRLALWDGRAGSPTHGRGEVVRMGIRAPVLVVVPPGVWHGLRNESGVPAGYLNIIDRTYAHAAPDNVRLPHDTADIPVVL